MEGWMDGMNKWMDRVRTDARMDVWDRCIGGLDGMNGWMGRTDGFDKEGMDW